MTKIKYIQEKIGKNHVMLTDVLHFFKTNELLIEDLNKCPACKSRIEFESGQETSHPGCGHARDFPPSHYCLDENNKDCEWSSTYDQEWEGINHNYMYVADDLVTCMGDDYAQWKLINKSIKKQSKECIDYIYNLIKRMYDYKEMQSM